MNGYRDRTLTAVVAVTPQGVIGRDGAMPWKLSSDLKRFKSLTMGGVLIMGRKTYESIGRPLPGRSTVVVTRNADWASEGVQVARSPEQALDLAGDRRVFVVGGAEIYRQLIDRCDRVFLTRVNSQVQGDTHLHLDWGNFNVVEQFRLPAGPRDDVPTEFQVLKRRPATG